MPESTAKELQFPTGVKSSAEYPSKIRFRIYDNLLNEGQETTKIILPVPLALANNYSVGYDDIETGLLGRIFQKTLGGVAEDVLRGNLPTTPGGLAGIAAGGIAEAATSSVAAGTAVLLDSDLGRGLRGKFGVSVNRAGQLTVNKPNNRNFSFRFEFVPKNRDESRTIEEIIKTFKVAMHPPTVGNDGRDGFAGQAGFFYANPAKMKIDFLFQNESERNTKLFSTWYCFLTNMEVNYHNAGAPSYLEAGYQTNKSISLSFTEITPLNRANLENVEIGADNMPAGYSTERTIGEVLESAVSQGVANSGIGPDTISQIVANQQGDG